MVTELRFQRRADVLFTTVDDEVVALDVEGGHCFGMNAVASAVWNLLEQPRSLSDICAELERGFDVDPDRCRQDIGELLSNLADEGLLVRQAA